MRMLDYYEVRHSDVAKEICKEAELLVDGYTQERIGKFIKENYYVFEKGGIRKKVNFLMRFTGIFFMLYYLVLFLFMPVKWFFTGKGGYDYDSKCMVFLKKWKNWIGF